MLEQILEKLRIEHQSRPTILAALEAVTTGDEIWTTLQPLLVDSSLQVTTLSTLQKLLAHVLITVADVVKMKDVKEEGILQQIKLFLTLVTSESLRISSDTLSIVIERCVAIYVTSEDNSTNEVTVRASLTQMVHLVFSRFEVGLSIEDGYGRMEAIGIIALLCSYADSNLIDKATYLSLDLLVSLFNTLGPLTRSDKEFVEVVRIRICKVVSMNGLSSNVAVFEHSIALFLVLVRYYRSVFKGEVEELFIVYLQILEMGNSSYKQKSVILQMLGKICTDSQCLMDVYLNYDCDFEMRSVYERVILICGKMAQGKDSLVKQDQRLHLRALNVLVSVVEVLGKWSEVVEGVVVVETEDVELITNKKQTFRDAVKVFNKSPKKGMKLFVREKFVSEGVSETAHFLLNTDDLSKSSLGEYLGDGEAFNIKVMHSFIDLLDFTGLGFVGALRHFLQAFRLPGEAQKIDRMMEKFADRYCELNPTVFAKADTAYTLAFSVIMLNTDQHSNQIKHRMDKPAFVKNNRGINDDGDLDDKYLEDLFEEIQKNEIIMEDERLVKIAIGWGVGESNEKKRVEVYKKEVESIKPLKKQGFSEFKSAASRDLGRPMFTAASWALMAALSVSFESAVEAKDREPDVAELCLKGFYGAIKLSCIFKLDTERDAYVSSLAKLTALGSVKELKEKNLKAIKTLIDVAGSQGEHLETGWCDVVKTLSLLDKKEESQPQLVLIDQIFTQSVKLSAKAIISFFKAVCMVSLEEVSIEPPRMYMLQKIVEIAHYNMARIRFEWTQIWRLLQPHFNKVACHSNIKVASYAVDSLRQLGVKFLEREELGHFSSQHEFLKSFESIIKMNSSPSLRELILNSLNQMIYARSSRIRSGWKSIFVTLVKVSQTDERLAGLAFQSVQVIFKSHFDDVVVAGAFVDLVSCLAECALLKGSGPLHDELVLSSIQMLQSCTKSLIERATDESLLKINNLPNQPYLIDGFVSEEHFYLTWFPILTAFSRVVSESEGVLVRTHTLQILFDTLRKAANLFHISYWKTISRNIIAPVFDDLNESEIKESSSAVIILGLGLLQQLLSAQFVTLKGDLFIPDSLDLIVSVMSKTNEKFGSVALTCFSQFLNSNLTSFDDDAMEMVVTRIESAFRVTLPGELVRCLEIPQDSHIEKAALQATIHIPLMSLDSLDFVKTIIKCITHLEFINTIKDFCCTATPTGLVIDALSLSVRGRILNCLYSSYAVARYFNSLTALRHAIYKRGWVAQLPNLVKQETVALSAYFSLLFHTTESNTSQIESRASGMEIEVTAKDSLFIEILDLFKRFTDLIQEAGKTQRDIVSFAPVVALVLKELSLKDAAWFDGRAVEIYNYAVKMVAVDRYLDRQELRVALIDFLGNIGRVYFM